MVAIASVAAVRFTILTAGSRGDVQPYLALGEGLRQVGHDVRLAAHEGFRDEVVARRLEFSTVTNLGASISDDPVWERWQRTGARVDRYVAHVVHIAQAARPVLEAILDDFWVACQGADVIIASASGFGSPLLANALRVPHCWGLLQPMSRTREFAHFMTPPRLRLPGPLRLGTYAIAEQVYWRLFRSAIAGWSRRVLGSAPPRKPDERDFHGRAPSPTFYAISPQLVPRPGDWSVHTSMHGFWFLDLDDWQPSDDLLRFLDDGPPPVYVALSAIKVTPVDRLAGVVCDALHRTGQRGLLSTYGGETPTDLPPAVMAIDFVPHQWLFERVAAIVHHGGAGTTASALRAGLPSVGVPAFFDQPFWSHRVWELGAGARPVPAQGLTADRLAGSLRGLTGNRDLQARARSLGELIRQEHGVRATVETLERAFSR